MAVPRRATVYREKSTQPSDSATVLTRGSLKKGPDPTLSGKQVDIQAGCLWVQNMPELFINKTNEAFLEVTVTADSAGAKTPAPQLSYPFKFEMKVRDKSFSANIAGAQIISGIEVGKSGMDFRIALTEIDKVNSKQLDLVKKFVDNNKIADVANKMLAGTASPVNAAEILGVFFNTVTLIDELNEDDVIWKERPKLDLRTNAPHPLYCGWYAFVASPKNGEATLPIDLVLSGGELYTSFTSDTSNVPFTAQTYFTWRVLETETRMRRHRSARTGRRRSL